MCEHGCVREQKDRATLERREGGFKKRTKERWEVNSDVNPWTGGRLMKRSASDSPHGGSNIISQERDSMFRPALPLMSSRSSSLTA